MLMIDPEQEHLAEYRQKRDFARTAEPAGGDPAPSATSPPRPVFVVQKHAASSLHYDFRLELDGVLKSWAVPKGPSLDPADKRLAVMTEDHPLEYATFEGVIPEGEYGGGTVLVWDTGWWEPDLAWAKDAKEAGPTDPAVSVAKGELKLVLHGSKLTGSWALVQMKGRGEKNWLLIKHRDEAARPGTNLVEEAPDSAVTGKSLEQVAAGSASSTVAQD
jgi:bifunctional non-homologous end joining protein LigD